MQIHLVCLLCLFATAAICKGGKPAPLPDTTPWIIDQYINGTTPMPVISRPQVKQGHLSAKVTAASKLISAQLHYTTGPHRDNKDRDWVSKPLTLEGNRILGETAPANATAWFIDVTDEREVLVSSEVMLQ